MQKFPVLLAGLAPKAQRKFSEIHRFLSGKYERGSASDLATSGTFNVNVENLDSNGNIENKISGSKTVSE